MRPILPLLAILFLIAPLAAGEKAPPERLLFDFEDGADLKDWSNLEPDAKTKEPAAKIELSTDHATSGKHSLKITFAGGRWPTITTTKVPADWMPYWTFKADVTVARPCLVGFTVLQEKSQRGGGWDATISRWTKTEFLKPGTHTVVGTLHDPNHYSINDKLGKVVRFEIFMYTPHDGESIYVDNIRIATAKETKPPVVTKFRVAGTDLEVSGVRELGKMMKSTWKKPEPRTLDEIETDFRAQYDTLKKKHPHAVLAILRDGEKGYDPAKPDKLYAGWKDAYWSSHGPDGETVERSRNTGHNASHEIFMRHRSPLMRVDLSSIPAGAKILAAHLIVSRVYDKPIKEHNPEQPNMWVVEPCNRPWEEYEVNAYEYARDKFWHAIGGVHYGPDPDFLPIYLAHGPSQGKVNAWDFTEAARFWTDGEHPNHGFMLHGDAGDWMGRAHSREAKEIRNRPAVLVIYEPGAGTMKRDSRLMGAWQAVSVVRDGKSDPEEIVKHIRWTFDGDRLTVSKPLTVTICEKLQFIGKGGVIVSHWNTDAEKVPPQLTTETITPTSGNIEHFIYEIRGDTLKICGCREKTPTEFSAGEGTRRILLVLKRGKESPRP